VRKVRRRRKTRTNLASFEDLSMERVCMTEDPTQPTSDVLEVLMRRWRDGESTKMSESKEGQLERVTRGRDGESSSPRRKDPTRVEHGRDRVQSVEDVVDSSAVLCRRRPKKTRENFEPFERRGKEGDESSPC